MLTEEQIVGQIQEVLDMLKPNFYMHGGDIELVKFEAGVVYVRLQGNCVGCPASTYTLKLMVEESLKQEVPQVQRVVDVDEV